MACKRATHGSGSGLGWADNGPFLVPSPEPLQKQRVNGSLCGNASTQLPKVLQNVCDQHFTADCVLNLEQHRAGLAARLNIKSESEPTLCSAADLGQVSPLTL